MPDEKPSLEAPIENKNDTVTDSSEQKQRTQAEGSMHELSNEVKANLAALKKGQSSGITANFGNPFKDDPDLQDAVEEANKNTSNEQEHVISAGKFSVHVPELSTMLAASDADSIRTADGTVRDNLIAYNTDDSGIVSDATNYKQGRIQESDLTPAEREQKRLQGYADNTGVVPFGGDPLSGGVQGGKQHNNGYFVMALGVEGLQGQNQAHVDVVNINIGDGMTLNGQAIMDGKPHHHTFPIKPSSGNTHWKWVDATVQKTDSQHIQLTIHRLSPSKEAPTAESQWDYVGMQYTLPLEYSPQKVSAGEFHHYAMSTFLNDGNVPEWRRKGTFSAVRIRETAK